MALIYCLEDDESIRELMRYALSGQGYHAEGFAAIEDFYRAMEKQRPDLILLDLMLPGEDGLSILQKIRGQKKSENIPVIIMTAKSGEYDIIRGLDAGADDYVTKPFGIMEMLSRIRSVLRRSKLPGGGNDTKLRFGEICIDEARRIVTVGEEYIQLTLKEFDLLCYFFMNKGIVLLRDQIMQAVWGMPFEIESRTIDMHVMSLRQKLKESGKAIRTVRGIGYCLGDKNI